MILGKLLMSPPKPMERSLAAAPAHPIQPPSLVTLLLPNPSLPPCWGLKGRGSLLLVVLVLSFILSFSWFWTDGMRKWKRFGLSVVNFKERVEANKQSFGRNSLVAQLGLLLWHGFSPWPWKLPRHCQKTKTKQNNSVNKHWMHIVESYGDVALSWSIEA